MRYKSTRGGSDGQTFEEVVMRGLAPDGGLYVPESVPKIDNATIDKWSALPFDQLAVEVRTVVLSFTPFCPRM
jgi:threonine synthase